MRWTMVGNEEAGESRRGGRVSVASRSVGDWEGSKGKVDSYFPTDEKYKYRGWGLLPTVTSWTIYGTDSLAYRSTGETRSTATSVVHAMHLALIRP